MSCRGLPGIENLVEHFGTADTVAPNLLIADVYLQALCNLTKFTISDAVKVVRESLTFWCVWHSGVDARTVRFCKMTERVMLCIAV